MDQLEVPPVPTEAQFLAMSEAERKEYVRKRGNAEGERMGCIKCPVCGDSRFWKLFHHVEYESGLVELDNARPTRNHRPFCVQGSKSSGWMCVECWDKATPEERLKHHDDLHKTKIASVPSVFMHKTKVPNMAAAVEGEVREEFVERMVPQPADKKRFDKDVAQINAVHDEIRKILGGA